MSLVPKDWSKEVEKLQQKSKHSLDKLKSENDKRNSAAKNSESEDLAKLSRPVQKTSFYFYLLYKRIWYWTFVSLPVDLILLLGLPLAINPQLDKSASEQISYILYPLCLLALVWFIKDYLISKISGLDNLRGNTFKILNKHPWLIFLLFALFIAFELLSKANQLGLIGAAVLGILLFASNAKSVSKGIKDSLKKHQDYKQDLTQQVESFNKFVFNLHLIPLLSSRLLVFISCCTIPMLPGFEPHFLLFSCFGCVMISLMQSEEKFFMIFCQRCGSRTSRFLAKQKECLNCINDRPIQALRK